MTHRSPRASFALSILLSSAAFAPADASSIAEPLEQVSEPSPFLACTADDISHQAGFVHLSAEVEPWVDVDPADPLHIVAAWQQDRWSSGGARGLRAGVSFDGGITWENVTLPDLTLCSGGGWLRASDPWLSFSPNGDLHFISLAFSRDSFQTNAMLASKSTDGGLTWSNPVTLRRDFAPRFNDKQTITADPTDANYVYAVWDRVNSSTGGGPALFVRTTDGGATWEPARVIHDPGTSAQTIGNQIVVLPDGTLVDFFTEIHSTGPFITSIALASKRSADKGSTWLPAAGSDVHFEFNPSSSIDPESSIPIRDGGFLFDVAVDPLSGAMYAVWQESSNLLFGRPTVELSVSRDGGATWSPPAAIAKTPPHPDPRMRQSFLPSVHVNAAGIVAVTYFDFRLNGSEPGSLADVWMVACFADTADCSNPDRYTEEVRLTDASMDILQAPFAGGLFLGDYMGLASAGGKFVAVFSQPHGVDNASVFSRVVEFGREDSAVTEGLGWWKHQVRSALSGNAGRAEVDAAELGAYLGDIRAAWDVYDAAGDLGDLLSVLQPRSGDPRDLLRSHLMALLLNVVSGRLTPPVEVREGLTAGEAVAGIISVLADPASTAGDLLAAKDLAEAINEGPVPLP